MRLAIPFFNAQDFFVSPADKTGENYPSYIVWNKKIKIGALWANTYEKDGVTKNYFSGSLFCGFLPDKKLKIVIFEDKNNNKSDIWAGSVFWSFEEKRIDIKSEEVDNLDYGSDEPIF